MMSEMTKRMRKKKNRTLAISAATPAIPMNPRRPAMRATTRKTMG